MARTKIEWTEHSWNPATGCTKVSAGCLNCYAERMAGRLNRMGQDRYSNGFEVTLHPEVLSEPERWRKPRLVFVCSMSDLFHEDVTDEFIHEAFRVMNDCDRHTFQILTKRPERLRAMASELAFGDNIWVGVTVESGKYLDRVDVLREIPAKVRFLSCEPLIGPLEDIDLAGIDQVIVGGESGPGARPMDVDWARELRDMCVEQEVAFFYKQQGAVRGKGDKMLDGVEWKQMPVQTV